MFITTQTFNKLKIRATSATAMTKLLLRGEFEFALAERFWQ